MNRFMSGYCATSLSAIFWPSLLPYEFLIPGVVIALILLYLRSYILLGVICAALWLTGFTELLLNYQYDSKAKHITARAEIISLVSQNSDFLSADIRLNKSSLISLPTQNLRIYWRTDQAIRVGDEYLFRLKPKSITSVANEGGFNQQKNLLSKHIIGKANVVDATYLGNSGSLRTYLINVFTKQTSSLSNRDLLLALLLGERQLFSDKRWQQLRASGTGHLVAISGLHLSVISVCCFWLSSVLLNWLVPAQGKRNIQLAIAITCGCAFFYAYLAGFAIATQRALIMLLVVMGLTLWHRVSSPWERLLIALFVVLVIDPIAILSVGLWLSFGALSIILICLNRMPIENNNENRLERLWNKAKLFLLIQLGLSLGLGALGSLFFGGLSLHSAWVNLLAVPWFSIVVIPVAFIGFVIWWLGLLLGVSLDFGLVLADKLITPFSLLINQVVQLPFSWLTFQSSWIILSVYSLVGIALLHLTTSKLKYWCLSLMSLPLLLHIFTVNFDKNEQWQLHALDVGQGLGVVLEKQGKALIYDTGAKYGQQFSYAKTVVVPFLQSKGLADVDYIIVSHSDNDHAGGLSFLLQRRPNAKLIGNLPQADLPCNPSTFRWQQLTIEILWPVKPEKGNNGSCVIRVTDGHHSLLLAGDIEKEAEYSMEQLGLLSQSDVLIVPHHGSRTSSTPEFVAQVKPQTAIFAAGYNNRYGFPKKDVMARYQIVGSNLYQTGLEGQVSVTFSSSAVKTRTYRKTIAPYWYNQLFNFGEFR